MRTTKPGSKVSFETVIDFPEDQLFQIYLESKGPETPSEIFEFFRRLMRAERSFQPNICYERGRGRIFFISFRCTN